MEPFGRSGVPCKAYNVVVRGSWALAVVIACSPGTRAPNVCDEGTTSCVGLDLETCTGGAPVLTQACATTCDPTLGCIACVPGSPVCADGDVHTCDDTGNIGPVMTACTGSTVCQLGTCVDACAAAATDRSYIGCEYWAVDLENAIDVIDVAGGELCGSVADPITETLMACAGTGSNAGTVAGLGDPPYNACPAGFACQSTSVCVLDAQHSPFAIVVANPQARSVDITVTGPDGTTFTQTVAADAVGVLSPQPNNIPDESLSGTMLGKNAYEITATLPIVAYQFNPLANVGVFSNDASLLIPRTAFDTTYYAMSWPTKDRRGDGAGQDFYGYLAVVAWEDGTIVEVTPTAPVQSSATQTSIAAGVPTQFTLDAFEVLNLEAAGPAGDLTGSKVTSVDGTQTFGVFGGHIAAQFGQTTPPDADHTDGPCCADHLEEMLYPTSTWGKTFAIARTLPRLNTPDLLRVIAQQDGTTVSFDPAPLTGSCGVLAAGAFCQVEIQADTEITASEPVLVGHFLESATWSDSLGGTVGIGDPSMALAVPIEQYRTDYILPVPMAYALNYFSISAPLGSGAVEVDGQAIPMMPFATHSRSARIQVRAGTHHLTCPDSCGVEVYGFSDAVSYQFAGGLDLKQIIF